MNMKKLMAGVAASALAVTSLATVGVSAADTTKTFNFVGTEGTMTLTYTRTVSFIDAADPDEVFVMASGTDPEEYKFAYNQLHATDADGYENSKLTDFNDSLPGTAVSVNGTKITVTGLDDDAEAPKSITRDATTTGTTLVGGVPTQEMFRVRTADDNAGRFREEYDLDLSRFTKINSIKLESTIKIDTGSYYAPEGSVKFYVGTNLELEDPEAQAKIRESIQVSYKSEKKESSGIEINADQIYTFEGQDGDTHVLILENNGSWNAPIEGTSLGHNLLRWTNDNIVRNRGAKLRINFMTPAEYKDAIEEGDLTVYPTVDQDWAHWQGANVLVPFDGSSSSTAPSDVMIGVNLKNTTLLQQAANIKNYSVEFDWDKLVAPSGYVVAGNVDSIAFRLNGAGAGVAAFNGEIAIKSIEIVIPDQADVPASDDNNTNNTPAVDNSVKTFSFPTTTGRFTIVGTYTALFGNADNLVVDDKIVDGELVYVPTLTKADGTASNLSAPVTLQLEVPSNVAKGLTTINHYKADGTTEKLAIVNAATYTTDGYIQVVTSSFSGFGIPLESEDGGSDEPAPAENNNPGTGVALVALPAILAAAGVVISKKRK